MNTTLKALVMASPAQQPAAFVKRPAQHGAADFVSWTWEMVNAGHEHIGWSPDGTTIVVTNPERLASHILPTYFRRSQYSSWVRVLNAYGFKKACAAHHALAASQYDDDILTAPPPGRALGRARGCWLWTPTHRALGWHRCVEPSLLRARAA